MRAFLPKTTLSILQLSLLLLYCAPSLLRAQAPPPEDIRPWVDTITGRLFWNKKQPAFLFMGTSPDGSEAIPLESKKTPQWARPFYLDTEGINYIRTHWAVDTSTKRTVSPQQEVLWEVYADSQPPKSAIHIDNLIRLANGKQGVSKENSIHFTSKDAMSGVRQIYYSLNGSDFLPFTTKITLTKEGENYIQYFADDNVGNREKVLDRTITADFTPPRTVISITGVQLKNNTITKKTNMELESHDELSGVKTTEYRIDKGEWISYRDKTLIPLSNIPDGEHTIYVKSTDWAGNVGEMDSLQFFMDNTPPITISDILGDKFLVGDKLFFSGRTKMKITAVDNRAGVKEIRYSIDGKPFEDYTEPFYMPNSPGWHHVKYYSIDSTENRTESYLEDRNYEYRMKMEKVYVDLFGPNISHALEGESFTRNDTVFVSPLTKITLSGVDSESGLKKLSFSIDDDAWEKDYTEPFDLQGLDPGQHKIDLYAYDNVGNRNVKTIYLIVDSESPSIDYRLSVAPLKSTTASGESIYPDDAIIYLTAQDNMTGIKKLEYSINGRALQPYSKPFSGLEKGSNRLLIKATDMVGNTTEETRNLEAR